MKDKNRNENKNFYRLVFVLLLIITILSCFYIIRYFYDMYISKNQSNLLNEINIIGNTYSLALETAEDSKN